MRLMASLRYLANREKILARSKLYRQARGQAHPKIIKAANTSNKAKIAAASLRWYYKRQKHCQEMSLARYHRNKKEINRKAVIRNNNRKKVDPIYRLTCIFRSKLWAYVRRPDKLPMWELIGCSGHQLREHIERLFAAGMTWANYGKGRDKWNIDHKRPIASFDLTKPEDQKACWHFSNLQPMWELDNLKKRATYVF